MIYFQLTLAYESMTAIADFFKALSSVISINVRYGILKGNSDCMIHSLGCHPVPIPMSIKWEEGVKRIPIK